MARMGKSWNSSSLSCSKFFAAFDLYINYGPGVKLSFLFTNLMPSPCLFSSSGDMLLWEFSLEFNRIFDWSVKILRSCESSNLTVFVRIFIFIFNQVQSLIINYSNLNL